MSFWRNLAVTGAVTAGLVAALVFLFPEDAQFVTVEDVHVEYDDGAIVVATLRIPAGQHLPLPEYARILVAHDVDLHRDAGFGDLLQPAACTDSTKGQLRILSVTGSTPVRSAAFAATGAPILLHDAPTHDFGAGVQYGEPTPTTQWDGGSGPGYGAPAEPTLVTLRIAAPCLGQGVDPAWLQVIIGTDATHGLASPLAAIQA